MAVLEAVKLTVLLLVETLNTVERHADNSNTDTVNFSNNGINNCIINGSIHSTQQ